MNKKISEWVYHELYFLLLWHVLEEMQLDYIQEVIELQGIFPGEEFFSDGSQ